MLSKKSTYLLGAIEDRFVLWVRELVAACEMPDIEPIVLS